MDNNFENLKFSDEQKSFFNKRLREELEAAGHDAKRIPESPDERALRAHETNDLRALDNIEVRAAFLARFGVNEFSKLHLRHTRQERERKTAEERQRALAEQKARTNRGL